MRRTLVAAALISTLAMAGAEPPPVQRVDVVAKRYSFTPAEIVLKRGVPAELDITALDFTHGFKVPDLDIRVDLMQGQVTRVTFTPDKAGRFDFLCDNFCGAGHEEMGGRIVVRD